MSNPFDADPDARNTLIRGLRSTLAKMELALGELDEPLLFLDGDGRIEWCNQPFCELIGKSKIHALGMDFAEVLPLRWRGEAIPPEMHPALRVRTEPSNSFCETYELPGSDATNPKRIEIRGRRVQHSAALGNAVIVIEDITLRERDLRQDRLASIGAVTSGLIHRLNSPLGFARSNVEYVRDEFERGRMDASEVREVLSEALDGLDQISSLFQSVVSFSDNRFRSGQQLDLLECVDTAVNLSQGQWDTVASLQVASFEGDATVWGDPGALTQALVQILANSAWAIAQRQRASTTGSYKGEITITPSPLDGWFEIDVRDNGIGVPPEVRDRIFAPFFTTRNDPNSQGQGLYVARTIVEDLHGGSLRHVAAGEHTHFVIRIPAFKPA